MKKLKALLIGLLLGVTGYVGAATFNLFAPANGVLVGNANSYITTSAASSNIIALWSGSCSASSFLRGDGSCAAAGGGTGSVTSVALSMPTGFSVGGSPVTTTGTLAVTTSLNGLLRGTGSGFAVGAADLTTEVAGVLPVANGGSGAGTLTGVLRGNGTSAFSAAVSSNIIGLWTGTCDSTTFLRADGSCQAAGGGGGGSVTSVALTVPAGLSVSGSPITTTGTFAITTALNGVLRGNGSGFTTGSVALGSEVSGTLPVGSGGSGAATLTGILRGNGTSAFTAAVSSNVISLWSGTCNSGTYLRGDGSCAAPATGSGTVTSVGLSAPSIFSVASSPVTTSGTLALTFSSGQTANQVLATPNGVTGAVGLRALVGGDIPAVDVSASGNGGIVNIMAGANGGTGNGFFAVSGPATSLKTFTFPNASATVLTTNATVTVAQGGSGTTSLSGILLGNGTSAIGTALSANVISLWTGTCNSGTFLRADGSCAAPTAVSGANPTASIGLTAQNGLATTYMRSDGAPALNVGISPTWTGTHTFSNGIFLPAGNATNPAWTFTGDPNTGLFSSGADALGFSTGGTNRMTLAADGGLVVGGATGGSQGSGSVNATALYVNGVAVGTVTSVASGTGISGGTITGAGTLSVDQAFSPTWTGTHTFSNQILGAASGGAAGTPNFTFSGDTNTGVYRASADILGIATGGNMQMLFASGGITTAGVSGGAQGSGTINATGLYINGVAVASAPAVGFGRFNNNGTTCQTVANSAQNVTSCTRTTTGEVEVLFNSSLNGITGAPACTVSSAQNASIGLVQVFAYSQSTGTWKLTVRTYNIAGVLSDNVAFSLVCNAN